MIRGKSMIQRVYEQAKLARLLKQVIVATDDERIAAHVREFGGEVVMTRADHESGTERMGEVAAKLEGDLFVNIQGDEPLIDPAQIDQVVKLLQTGARIATLVCPIREVSRFQDPNAAKVVIDKDGNALYFSRAAIPFQRDNSHLLPPVAWQHIGIYGFRRQTLLEIVKLPMHPLEQIERLEQLRWLAHGYSILCGETQEVGRSVDSPADLAAIEKWIDTSAE